MDLRDISGENNGTVRYRRWDIKRIVLKVATTTRQTGQTSAKLSRLFIQSISDLLTSNLRKKMYYGGSAAVAGRG